jgi:hypothetical protein
MNLRARVKRLERRRDASADPFPGAATLLGDYESVQHWLERHGYANLVEAVQAGECGWGMQMLALKWWLENHRYPSAGHAVAADALKSSPAVLADELRVQALTDYYHLAGGAIEGRVWQEDLAPIPPDVIREWHAIGDHLSGRPITPPDDALLERALRLVLACPGERDYAEISGPEGDGGSFSQL